MVIVITSAHVNADAVVTRFGGVSTQVVLATYSSTPQTYFESLRAEHLTSSFKMSAVSEL